MRHGLPLDGEIHGFFDIPLRTTVKAHLIVAI
jgi:hypothetical protein